MIDTLFLLQLSCLIITAVIALTLSMARLHIVRRFQPYETSRWLIVSALLLLSFQYFLQMLFNFRASGDDVGAMVNILFYTPATFMVSYAVLNLECNQEKQRKYLKVGLLGYVLIVIVSFVGYLANGSLHIGAALYVMDALFFACMLYFFLIPIMEIRRSYKIVEDSTGSDITSYQYYVRNSFYLLCVAVLVGPFTIISTTFLFIIGPLFLIVLLSFVVNFIALGYNALMLRVIQESYYAPQPEAEIKIVEKEKLSSERVASIQEQLDSWVSNNGYRDADLSLSTLALALGVRRRELTIFFENHEQETFRVWLSNIRFSAAKKLLLEHPEYSNDAISAECGFSSRAQLYNIFRNKMNMTPKEFLAAHKVKES